MDYLAYIRTCAAAALWLACLPGLALAQADAAFNTLAGDYVDQFVAFSPVSATQVGDHRYDDQLDQVSEKARQAERAFAQRMLGRLERLDRSALSRANQVDYAMLKHALHASLFWSDRLQEWAWNPLVYTSVTGGSVYGLMARDFAPLAQRLANVAARLEQFPRFLAQVRETLVPTRVPQVHAQTAVRQNRGVLSIIENLVRPQLDALEETERERLLRAIETATAAVEEHQHWLEQTLLPAANGEFRIGAELFDEKLRLSLHTPLSRAALQAEARAMLHTVRARMFTLSQQLYLQQYPSTKFPPDPSPEYQQVIVRAALELTYRDLPPADQIMQIAEQQLQQAIDFVREKNLVEVPDDPVQIIEMPEFQRGVSVAYCDSPGPLDAGQKTFYAVSPIPQQWTDAQVHSFLREYNLWSIQDLTVHEAVPGHYLQLALSNRYPSTLRSVLYSGTFVEGWAVYAEQLMSFNGYNGDDPRQKLITLKWLLRSVTNALMDIAIHAGDMSEAQAMELMVEQGFQEEREASLKWVRAQLTSAQLSTYFVGYQEHVNLREEVLARWGERFSERRYHDTLLSFGSPPPQFVRALMLEQPIPQ